MSKRVSIIQTAFIASLLVGLGILAGCASQPPENATQKEKVEFYALLNVYSACDHRGNLIYKYMPYDTGSYGQIQVIPNSTECAPK